MTSKQSWAFDIDRLSDAVNGLQKCLQCTICLELMTTPMKTRCGHSFCQICIGNILRHNAFCPLCKKALNKRNISKDDHLESCIQKFKRLMIAIQTDSHIDIQSYVKQPRDTRESCSNSGSSQSSVSHKRKQTSKQSICSKPSTSKTDRPSTSRTTIIDCNNPQSDVISLAQLRHDQTSLKSLNVNPHLSTDGNDNTLYDSPDVKVRTWIYSLIENESNLPTESAERETCPSKQNAFQLNKDTKKRSQSCDRKTVSKIHTKIRTKDRNKFADAEKSHDEEYVGRSRDSLSSATSSSQYQIGASDRSSLHATNTSAIGDKPSPVDTTWSRVKEFGKEMRGKKKKVKKLSVSTEKSTSKSNESAEKNKTQRSDKDIEKDTEETHDVNKNVPRIIQDIILSPESRYESLNKRATNDDPSSKKANIFNRPRESNSQQQDTLEKLDLSDAEIKAKASTNETATHSRKESFANDNADFSVSENTPLMETSMTITLEEGKKLPIRNLNRCQMNEIILGEEHKGLVDNANVPGQHLVQEDEKDKEQDVEIITELHDSPSHQKRLTVLTPQKLNESVSKRSANHDSDSQTPTSKSASPAWHLSDRTSLVNNDAERMTRTPGEGVSSELRSPTPSKARLSLNRNPKTLQSPLFSRVPLMERLLLDEYDSKGRKSVNSSMSNNRPSFGDRLATARRDLSSQITAEDRPSTSQSTTAAVLPSSDIVVVEDNERNVGGKRRHQERRLSVESTTLGKSGCIDNQTRKKECSFFVKFTQLGTLIRRRDVKYHYQSATKGEQRLPGKVRLISVCNMQAPNKDEIQYCAGDKLRSLESSFLPLNDSQDSTGVTAVENVYYVHNQSVVNLDNFISEVTTVPASSTPKADAADRRLDHAETTMVRGNSSTNVINKSSIAEEALRTPRADQSCAMQQRSPQARSHTTDSVRLLSPDKDSQLRFLTIDSPIIEDGQLRLASSTQLMQPEPERGSTSIRDNDSPVQVRDLQSSVKTLEPSFDNKFELAKKRKRNGGGDNDDDDGDDDNSSIDDNSSVSANGISSQSTMHKVKNNKKEQKSRDKASSHSSTGKKRRLSSTRCDQDDEVCFVDSDDHEETPVEKKFKKIYSISDSDTESESSVRVTKKSNRNKSSDRCDQENNASMTNTHKRRKTAKRASDEDLRIRSIVDKWSNEHGAAQKRSNERTRSTQDIVNNSARLTSENKMIHRRSSFLTNSSENRKRSSTKSSERNTESDLFFESNSIFNSEGLEQLATRQSGDKSSRGQNEQESPSSMDPLADDIINKVLQINRSQQSNPSSTARLTGVNSRTNDDGASQRSKSERHEHNMLQDNFDEIIANVELPQSEDVIPCSEPAHRNPDHNLNRTLTEQNMSSCPAMMNESRDIARHGQMKPASSTVDIFEHCGSSGKSAKKAHSNTTHTSGNSDKENTLSHGQRKHDHAEEDRRDKKNVATRSPDATDKAGREKIVSKNNVSQEKRNSFFDRVEVEERTPRTEKGINVPAGSTSRADGDNGRVEEQASNESNAKNDVSFDSLMNITLHQARLKMLEEDLFGVMASRTGTKTPKPTSDDLLREEQRTPRKKKRGVHERNAPSQEHSADEDDIVENTPETKMRNSGGSGGKTISSDARQNIAMLNLSPIPSLAELTRPSSTTSSSRKRTTSKSERGSTPICRPDLMYPLYQSTPKVTSSSITTGHRDYYAPTTDSKGQRLDKQRATTSGAVVSSSAKPRTTDDSSNASGNACQQSDREKLCFVCTGLTTIQIASVQRFARQYGADFAKQFDPSVTHVIVNTSGAENAAKSTLKYLQGIAHCKWVVSYKWIEDCTDEHKLLPEHPYEATTQSADINGPGPRNSRLSQGRLFESFTFLCVGPYDNVSLSQYQDLLRATGATVVNSLEALAAQKKSLRGVVIQGDIHECNTIESWYREARAAPILIDWIVECIGHYKLFQLIPYIQTLSPQNYCAIGYPREIVGEEEYSDTSG